MIKIKCIKSDDGCIIPETRIPNSAVSVVCDGEFYIVYEDGDEIPENS